MLAVVKEHLGPGFSVKEVPYPVLRDTDVIIKVRSVGICGSDGPILAGTRPVPYPLTPGHEFSGDVVEVAEKSRASVKFKRLTGEDAIMVTLPQWLEREKNTLKGTVTKMPAREDIDMPIEEHLIVELYSK